MPTPVVSRCHRCGHLRDAHEHYRGGTECGLLRCGCVAFEHPARGLAWDGAEWLAHHVSAWLRAVRRSRA